MELGSGAGTGVLAREWDVWSVEHDPAFLDRQPTRYIYAPIVDGWYDPAAIRAGLPAEYDLLLVDGPPGRIGRAGLARHLDLFRRDIPYLFDDVQRRAERDLAEAVARELNRELGIWPVGDGRYFATASPGAPASGSRSPSR